MQARSRAPGPPAASDLYNLADFMLGLRSSTRLSNVLVANLRQNMHFMYLQDDVRMSDKLTLNLGIRYEYATPHWEKDNLLTNWDVDSRKIIRRRTVRSSIARSSIQIAITGVLVSASRIP